MANQRRTPLHRVTWLAFVLVSLMLPVSVVAHGFVHDHEHETAHVLDQCLFCKVASQQAGPLPTGKAELPVPRRLIVAIITHPGSKLPITLDSASIRVRGPPTA